MYALRNENILHEIPCGNNFGYVLQDDIHFVSMDYKVLQSQTSRIFVRCMKMLYNGKLQLYYITNECRPVSAMLTEMTPDLLINIAVNIFENVMEVQNNGFLSSQNIDLSWEKIFVDPGTLKVKLVYLPIDIKLFANDTEFQSALRSNLVQFINKYFLVRNERLDSFFSDLSNGEMSIGQIYKKYKAINEKNHNDRNAQKCMDGNATDTPFRMKAVNAPEHFEVVLNKDNMRLGSRQEFADIVIPFNKRISRKHCRVVHNSKGYFIADEKSKNGTFVNNKRLVPHQFEAVHRGDFIRLADSVFQLI